MFKGKCVNRSWDIKINALIPFPLRQKCFFNHMRKQFLPNNQNNIFLKPIHSTEHIFMNKERKWLCRAHFYNMHMRFSCGQFDEPGWTEKVKSRRTDMAKKPKKWGANDQEKISTKKTSYITYFTTRIHFFWNGQGLFLFKRRKNCKNQNPSLKVIWTVDDEI